MNIQVPAALPNEPSEKQLERFIDSLGLKHFVGAEFTPYWSRKRKGVSNSCPPVKLWPNIVKTLYALDNIRFMLGQPVEILSSYRDEDYNAAVGGERNSYHMRFMAIDFTSENVSTDELWKVAKKQRGQVFTLPDGSQFTFQGGIGYYPKSHFIHIDCRGFESNW